MKIVCFGERSDLPESHLIAGLARNGHEVSWLGGVPHVQQQLLADAGVALYDVAIKSKLDLRALCTVRQHMKALKPDVVCAFTGKTISIMNLALTGLKIAPLRIAYRGAMSGVSRFDPTSYLTYRHPALSAIMCVSQAVYRDLAEQGISESKLFQIYKGHDPVWYRAWTREQLLQEFSIPTHHLVFGCVANMRDNKGVDVFLEAAAHISAELPVTFLFVGRSDQACVDSLIKRAPQIATRVIFAGFRTDSAAIIGACDIAAQLSKWREGLPKAAIEAMIQGVPLIATPIGGAAELVVDGVTGIFVPPESTQAVAQAVMHLANNPEVRVSMGKASQLRISERFTIKQTVLKFEEMLRDLLIK
jgi:glycosyltransferase involved in cell wall biosynthesis